MSISFGDDGFSVAIEVDACECGGANGAHRMCPVAANEIKYLVAATDRERDEAIAIVEKVRDAIAYGGHNPDCDIKPGTMYVPIDEIIGAVYK